MRDRIIEFLRKENKSSAQFAEEIGVQPSGISHILSGRNNPSLDFVTRMLEKYHFISSDWLLFGKGPMYKEKTLSELFNGEQSASPVQQPVAGEQVKVKVDKMDHIQVQVAGKSEVLSSDALIIKKIVWFYSDNTFEEYLPRKE